MARGKHSTSAEARRAIDAAEKERDNLQRALDRSTRDYDVRVADLEEQARALRALLKHVEGERDAAISPKLDSLQAQLDGMRKELDTANNLIRYEREIRKGVTREIVLWIEETFSATHAELAESILRLHLHAPLVRAPGRRPLPSAAIQRAYEYVRGDRTKPWAGNDELDAYIRQIYEGNGRLLHALMLGLMGSSAIGQHLMDAGKSGVFDESPGE